MIYVSSSERETKSRPEIARGAADDQSRLPLTVDESESAMRAERTPTIFIDPIPHRTEFHYDVCYKKKSEIFIEIIAYDNLYD